LDILEGAEKWWDSSACIQEKLDTGALELARHQRFSFLKKLLSVTVLLLSRLMEKIGNLLGFFLVQIQLILFIFGQKHQFLYTAKLKKKLKN
jgi:hypothetical protein